jgi:hypothetical protein
MDIITIEGDALSALLAEALNGRMPYRLRVARDVDGVKFKIDEGMWTPPYPEADEDVRRREQARHPATGGNRGFEDDRW